jgi:hypothetical protein
METFVERIGTERIVLGSVVCLKFPVIIIQENSESGLAKLFGVNYKKQELMRRIGDLGQIG